MVVRVQQPYPPHTHTHTHTHTHAGPQAGVQRTNTTAQTKSAHLTRPTPHGGTSTMNLHNTRPAVPDDTTNPTTHRPW